MRKQNVRCGENATCISEHVEITFCVISGVQKIELISAKRG
jgi:hypothetical protein